MKTHLICVAAFICAMVLTSTASAQSGPNLTGVVTEVAGPTDFRVDTTTVHCTPGKTHVMTIPVENGIAGPRTDQTICTQWPIGRRLLVYGKIDHATDILEASRIDSDEPNMGSVAGFALIDKVLETPSDHHARVRADGYEIVIQPESELHFAPKATPANLSEVSTNQWIKYDGTLRRDGTVLASVIAVLPNQITRDEARLRDKNEFDASAVEEKDKQSGIAKWAVGLNTKRIPVHHDDAMQARVNRIGSRVVPQYQQALASTDPTRLNFRFQVVDLPKSGFFSLPSGIILIPYQTIDRLNNDDQLAEVLAEAVAAVLQKQQLFALPELHRMLAASIAANTIGLFFTPIPIATALVNSEKKKEMLEEQMEARSRMALCLMNDAGFRLSEAPLAWWKLKSHPGKEIWQTSMPEESRYIYGLLATAWRPQMVQLAEKAP